MHVGEIETRMEPVDRPSNRQSKAGYAFARRHATPSHRLGIQTQRKRRGGVTLNFVVEVNHACIERHNVSDFINQHRKRFFDVERRTKGTRDFVKRVDFAMRITDLIVSSKRGVLTGQRNLILRRWHRIARRANVNLIDESAGFDFGFEFWQMLSEKFDDSWIEVRAGAF